jgi:hypothetical protein
VCSLHNGAVLPSGPGEVSKNFQSVDPEALSKIEQQSARKARFILSLPRDAQSKAKGNVFQHEMIADPRPDDRMCFISPSLLPQLIEVSIQKESMTKRVAFYVRVHFAHYNFVRQHKTLRVTPAMAAGVSDRLWTLEELVEQTSR